MLKNVYRNTLLFLVSPCKISLAWVPWVICLLGFAVSLLWYPGWNDIDVYVQYVQSVTGVYGDWHPPIMAATWRLIRHIYFLLTGQTVAAHGLMYLLQSFLLWGGILMVLRSARNFWKNKQGGKFRPWIVFVITVFLLSWLMLEIFFRSRFIVKDILMTGCYLWAVGILFNWPEKSWKKYFCAFMILLFLFYATALRHNSIFSTLPLLFWLIWLLQPRKTVLPLLVYGCLLWGIMLGTIHYVNYGLLGAMRLYPLQERFYADIFKINYETKVFVIPPNTFGNDFSGLAQNDFYSDYVDILFVERAFSMINAKAGTNYHFLSDKIFITPKNDTREYKEATKGFIANHPLRTSYQLRPVEESVIRDLYPKDYVLLREAWVKRIFSEPVIFIKYKLIHFVRFLSVSSFLGVNCLMFFLINMLIIGLELLKVRGERAVNISPLCLSCAALFYLLPYFIFLTDNGFSTIRYLYWFFAVSIISIATFCLNSEFISYLLSSIMDYWEGKHQMLIQKLD